MLFCLSEFYRAESTDRNETAVSLSSLCLTYTSICQKSQTLEQSPSGPSSTQTAPYLVIQTQTSAARYCHLSPSILPSHFYICLPPPPLCVCHFLHQFHPYLSSLAVPQPLRSIAVMPRTVTSHLHVSLFPPLLLLHLFVLFFKVS